MTPKKITNRGEITKACFSILWEDKELLVFSLLSGLVSLLFFGLLMVFLFGSFLLPLLNMSNTENAIVAFDPMVSFLVFFFGVIVVRLLAFTAEMFFIAAMILSVDERMEGKDPRFFPILKKTLTKRKALQKALLHCLIPLKAQFFSLWYVKQFLLHEILLHDRSVKEAVARTQEYQEQAWVRDLVVSLKWSGVLVPFYLLGLFIIPISNTALTYTGLIDVNNPVQQLLSYVVSFLAMLFYFAILSIVTATLEVIYQTILYKVFVEHTPMADVKDLGMKFVIRNVTTGTEKQIPL